MFKNQQNDNSFIKIISFYLTSANFFIKMNMQLGSWIISEDNFIRK